MSPASVRVPLRRRQILRSLGFLVALAASAGACATSQGGTPRPFPTPGGATIARRPDPVVPATFPGHAPARSGIGAALSDLIDTALQLQGIQYRWGGADLNGFDCSGFTQYVFAQHGVFLPREVQHQYREGQAIRARDIRAGDLLFFTTTDPGASHVAIALDGDEFVHAPSSTGVVRIERLSSSYWSRRFVGARRVE